MTQKFNPGDTVRCTGEDFCNLLIKGKTYKVTNVIRAVRTYLYYLEGIEDSFYEFRFEKVVEENLDDFLEL